MDIELDMIRTDGGTQPRAQLDLFTVHEYADALKNGEQFPPVVLFFDGNTHWLADGFHRLEAHKLIDRPAIAAEIRPGTVRDAVLYSVGANAAHGLRRTNADKRQAVMTMLNDPEWAQWSDREIARMCNVSHEYVRSLRPVVMTVNVDSDKRIYNTRWGTPSTMNTASIGRVIIQTETREESATPANPAFSISLPAIPMLEEAPAPDQEQARALPSPARYPLAIVLSRQDWEKWQYFKTTINTANDTMAFKIMLEGAS